MNFDEICSRLRHFELEMTADGVAELTIARPPVNAFSYEVYEDFEQLVSFFEQSEEVRSIVIGSKPDARAWSGGAELKEFLQLDHEKRLKRFEFLNLILPRFYHLPQVVIAGLNNHAVGVGFCLATLCDFRVAAETAFFSLPEIDRGVSMGGGFFFRLNLSQGLIREMILTGRRFTGEELRHTGLFNYVLPKDEVLPKARELAGVMAAKSARAVRATKGNMNRCELIVNWEESFRSTQVSSADLTAGSDSKEGIKAFLDKREPTYAER